PSAFCVRLVSLPPPLFPPLLPPPLLPPPVPPSPGLGRLGSTTGGRTDTSRPSRTPPREEQPARTAALMTNVATTARCKLRCTEAFLAEFLADRKSTRLN